MPGPTVVLRGGPKDVPTVMLASEWEALSMLGGGFNGAARPAYEVYYDGGKFGEACVEDFKVLQDRAINGFDSFLDWDKNFGLPEATCLSEGILQIQDKAYQTHKGR